MDPADGERKSRRPQTTRCGVLMPGLCPPTTKHVLQAPSVILLSLSPQSRNPTGFSELIKGKGRALKNQSARGVRGGGGDGSLDPDSWGFTWGLRQSL